MLYWSIDSLLTYDPVLPLGKYVMADVGCSADQLEMHGAPNFLAVRKPRRAVVLVFCICLFVSNLESNAAAPYNYFPPEYTL